MRQYVTAAALLVLTACAAPATTPGTSSPSTSAGAPAAQRRAPAHLDTDAWTQAMANESGQEIHIRNKSTVPIIVTEVTLSSCMNPNGGSTNEVGLASVGAPPSPALPHKLRGRGKRSRSSSSLPLAGEGAALRPRVRASRTQTRLLHARSNSPLSARSLCGEGSGEGPPAGASVIPFETHRHSRPPPPAEAAVPPVKLPRYLSR